MPAFRHPTMSGTKLRYAAITCLAIALLGQGFADAVAATVAETTRRAGSSPDAKSTWEALGPLGGEVMGLSLAADDPATVYLLPGNDMMTRIHRSEQGGDDWAVVGVIDSNGEAITGDPSNASVLYVGGGLYVHKSVDAGVTWSEARLNYFRHTSLHDIVVHPDNADIVYGVGSLVDGHFKMAVFKSSDGGAHWSSEIVPPELDLGELRAVCLHPHVPETVYVAGTYKMAGENYPAFARSENGGSTWDMLTTGLIGNKAYDIAIDPLAPDKLFCLTDDGIFTSDDGGLTWMLRQEETGYCIAVDPNDPQTVYVGGYEVVYRSADGGASWIGHTSGVRGHEIHDLVIDPDQPTRLLAASQHGVLRSESSGSAWSPSNSGFFARQAYLLAIAPSAPDTIMAAIANGGLHKSLDGGDTWLTLPEYDDCGDPTELVIDPVNPDLIYLYSGG